MAVDANETEVKYHAPTGTAPHRAVVAALDSQRYLPLLDELDRLAAEPPLTRQPGGPVPLAGVHVDAT